MVNKPKSLDRCFSALGDPTRREIVQRLARGQVSVTNLATSRGVTVAAVLKHLSVLESAGLIRTEKVGRLRQCTLTPQPMQELAEWLNCYRTLWEARFDRLERFLKQTQGAKK
jgi:DNA-binding transcriptional ArsR family regulator